MSAPSSLTAYCSLVRWDWRREATTGFRPIV